VEATSDMAQRFLSDRSKIALLLGPTMVVIVGLFLGSLTIVLIRSFGYMPIIGKTDLSLDAYGQILGHSAFYRSLLFSLHIALTSTLLATVIAIGAALLLRQNFAGRSLLTFLFQLGLTVPHLIGAIGVLYVFSQSGLIARLSHMVGLINRPAEFPALVLDRYGIGIILHYVWKEVPFIGLIVLAQMQVYGAKYENVARSLGATRWQAFRHVLLPLILPAILSASVLVFAFTFGAYEIPLLLGPNAPAALPVEVYRRFTDVDLAARPQAMAIAVVMTVICAVLVLAYQRLLRNQDHR
jgi:putative spermidine/putrescine transport system permease protein